LVKNRKKKSEPGKKEIQVRKKIQRPETNSTYTTFEKKEPRIPCRGIPTEIMNFKEKKSRNKEPQWNLFKIKIRRPEKNSTHTLSCRGTPTEL
jgi:hypothetical protein